jgi:hypothetical protein
MSWPECHMFSQSLPEMREEDWAKLEKGNQERIRRMDAEWRELYDEVPVRMQPKTKGKKQ